MKKIRKVKCFTRKWISIALVLCMILVVFPASAEQLVRESTSWRDKICADTWEAMENAAYDELIPVWIFRELIEEEIIEEQLYQAGFDPALYENPERLNAEIIEPMVTEVVATVGYDVAHFVENRTYNYQLALALEEDPLLTDFEFDFSESRRVSSSRDEVWQAAVELDVAYAEYEHAIGYDMSLVEWHIHQVMDEYMMTRRGILYDNYVAENQEFVEQYIGDYDDRILYSGYFTTTVIAELTANEIKAIARIREVELISRHEELYDTIEVDDVFGTQIGVAGTNGTRARWNGSGIRVGMIEPAVADVNAPQLRGMAANRFVRVQNIGENDANVIPSTTPAHIVHATKVASIMVGQRFNAGTPFEGVVPSVTRLYMAGTAGVAVNTPRAVQEMAARGVHVVNISAGINMGLVYTAREKDIDRIIFTSRMVVVKSAGNVNNNNPNGNVTCPGNAMNVITVGNADTTSAFNPIHVMNPGSSFRSPNFLPNKPDIVAPGTSIRTIRRVGNNDVVHTDTGTSFAAPFVAGVAAQMIQVMHVGGFSTPRSAMIKAALALSADAGMISGGGDAAVPNHLRVRSGAGFLDARGAVAAMQIRDPAYTHIGTTLIGGEVQAISHTFGVSTGTRVHIALAIDQSPNNIIVSEVNETASIHMRLWCLRDNRLAASSTTTKENIEIIRTGMLLGGSYRLDISLHRGAARGRSGTFSAVKHRFGGV